MKVKLTRADIREGKRGKSELCPVACAIRRTINEEWQGDVTIDKLAVFGDSATVTFTVTKQIDLPTRATTFINRFDAGQSVKPGLTVTI